jgi:tetratricopeptide (TPR) repeat protein
VSGCNKLKARDALNKGVAQYKAGKYDAAIEFFKQAKTEDPELLNARLYLATAYASQYIPGAPSPENIRNGEQAIEEFKGVLEKDPGNIPAIDGIGSVLYNMAGNPFDVKRMEESRSYHTKHIELSPNDPDPYYWVGVIDWSLAWRRNKELRAEWNQKNPKKAVKDDQPLPDSVREDFVAGYGKTVDEAIAHLKKAIDLRPDYDDAMAYLNLMYRQKADMVVTAAERGELLKQADDLVDRVKAIKQQRAAPPAPGD